jgi:lipase chaperone LimK
MQHKALASATRSHSVTSVPISRPALMGQTDISSIRDLLHAWVSAFVSEPEEDDVETVSKYLMQLARVRDFHQAQLVVQYLTMLINRSVSQSPSSSESINVGQAWKFHIEKLRNRLDHEVYKLYQCKLKWST